jgi:Flp pilus assembly protein CpaB
VELEYSDKNSRRSKVYIAVGVIIALIIGGVVFVALQSSALIGETEVEMRTVVVAAREIPSRKAVEEGDVEMREVPADPTNATAFTRIDEVLGRVTGVPVATGQLLTQTVLASTSEGQTFSILEPGQEFDQAMPDLRAVSISVPDDRAVAGTLIAGQRVDLIATMTVNPPAADVDAEDQGVAATAVISGPSTKTTLQQLQILARNGALYILRTDLGTAEKISELTAAGAQFTLALRVDLDDREAETEGSTVDMLLEEYEFPAPADPELDGR